MFFQDQFSKPKSDNNMNDMLANDVGEQYMLSGDEEDKLRAQDSTWDSENDINFDLEW